MYSCWRPAGRVLDCGIRDLTEVCWRKDLGRYVHGCTPFLSTTGDRGVRMLASVDCRPEPRGETSGPE